VVGFCECGNEPSDSIKFLDYIVIFSGRNVLYMLSE
jgi:hypothetical protein